MGHERKLNKEKSMELVGTITKASTGGFGRMKDSDETKKLVVKSLQNMIKILLEFLPTDWRMTMRLTLHEGLTY